MGGEAYTPSGGRDQDKGYRILVVDDEPSLRHLLGFHLARAGHRVLDAGSGEEALRVAGTEVPDLVLLDLGLPGIDGLETLRRLRDRGAEAPVIVMTAHGSVDAAIDAMKFGAFDFLTKPLDVDRLLIVVRNALSLSQLSRQVHTLRGELHSVGLTTRPPAHDEFVVPLDEVERRHILRAVEACRGNLSQAARLLDIGRTTLYRKLQRYGVMGNEPALAADGARLDA